MLIAALLAAALTPDQKAVLAPVDALFAALAARDGAAMRAVVRPDGGAIVARELPDGTRTVRRQTLEDFATGLQPSPDTFEERLYDPLIRIDGDIAMVWGRYDFRINGKVHHCGTDHFELVREAGAWKIANLSWSSRTTGCVPH